MASTTKFLPVVRTNRPGRGADVSAFRPMSIPDDLRALLEGREAKEAVR